MKEYFMKYSNYFMIIGAIIGSGPFTGFTLRRIGDSPVALQVTFGLAFILVGIYGLVLKRQNA